MYKQLIMPAKKELILVIGGSGFIGQNLIERLIQNGYNVRNLDLTPIEPAAGRIDNIVGNYTNKATAEEAINGCDIIYHLASTTVPKTSNDDPCFDISSNLLATVSILDIAVKYNIRKFIFASSGGTVYGVPKYLPICEDHPTNPICSYGIVKLSIEKYLSMYYNLHGLQSFSLRISNPYGPKQNINKGQGVVAAFCHKILNEEPIEVWGDGSITRDYIYIDDLISAMLKVLETDRASMTLNIGYGKGYSLNQIIDKLEDIFPSKFSKIVRPGRNFDVPAIYLNISKAQTQLNWSPLIDLDEGLTKLKKHLFSLRNL